MKNYTKPTILLLVLAAAIVIPFSVMDAVAASENASDKGKEKSNSENHENSETSENSERPDIEPPKGLIEEDMPRTELEKKHGRQLSDLEVKFGPNGKTINENALNGLIIAVENSPKVRPYLGGETEYRSYAQYLTEDGWQPVMNFFTDDKQSVLTVKMEKGKVIDVDKSITKRWGTTNSYAIADYNDTSYAMQGIGMLAIVPDYDHVTNTDWTAHMVNMRNTGGLDSDLCNSNEAPDTYWGQFGMDFSDQGVRIGYTDTFKNCVPAYLPIPFDEGDTLDYRLTYNDTSDQWHFWVNNIDDGGYPYEFQRNLTNVNYNVEVESTNTSFWFENSNDDSNGWDDGFAEDPVIEKLKFNWKTNSNWYVWNGEDTKIAGNCDTGTDGDDLMSGDPTWNPMEDLIIDVSEIEDKCKNS